MGHIMEFLVWTKVNRKRNRNAKYTDSDYVLGYDLDIDDLARLVEKFNSNTISTTETQRLYDHVRTVVNIVMENPKINPRSTEEKDGVYDAAFIDCWGSMSHIRPGATPYSYMYRSAFTAGCRYFTKKINQRKKEAEIDAHINEMWHEYMDSISDGKVRCG